MYLEVAAVGKKYREMHVDGRSTMQVFLFDSGIGTDVLARAPINTTRVPIRVWVLRNARFAPDPVQVKVYPPQHRKPVH